MLHFAGIIKAGSTHIYFNLKTFISKIESAYEKFSQSKLFDYLKKQYSLSLVQLYNQQSQTQLMENQINIHTVRELLIKIQSEDVKEAEQKLKEMSTNNQFFAIMYTILTDSQQQEWVKSITASVLNHLFTQKLDSQNINVIYSAIEQIILSPQIKQIDKRIFEKTIIRFLEEATQDFRQKMLLIIGECLKNIYYYDSAYLIIACIAVADIPLNLIEGVINTTYQPILSSVEVNVENANLLNQMLKMWIVIIDKLLMQKSMRPILQKMISSDCLFGLLNSIYLMHSSENTLLCFEQGLYELNFLKYQASQLNKRMLSIQIERAGQGFSKIIQFTKLNLIKIAGSLSKMALKRNKIEQMNCQDLGSTLFSIMRMYLTIRPEQFKLQDIITIQNHIIFPFIAIDDLEIHRFQQSPEDFNSLAEDCCDKQTFGIIKTEACKLLESFGDKSQTSLKYAVNRAIQSIKVKLGFTPSSTINQNLQDLSIQTSFLVLSIFSYGISSYPDQLNSIRMILNDQRLKNLPPIQLSRIFTFLAYNYCQIYKNPTQGQGWLNLAINYQAHPTTSYCAFDCFSNIVEQYFNQVFLDKLTDQISIGKIGLVWEIISKLLEKHFTSISSQGIALLISKLFIRLNKEITLLKTKQKKDSLDIINCLRTFISLLKELRKEQTTTIAAHKDYILRQIWPILSYYKEVVQFDIEDQIVKVAIQIVKTMDCIDPQIYPHLQDYITTFMKNSFSQKIYLRFFNQFMFKADFTRDMGELMKIFVVLRETMVYSMGKLFEKSNKLKPIHAYRLILCNTLVVVQNALAIYGTHLLACNSRQFFDQISSMCFRLIPNKSENVQKTPSGYIILARALNTYLLCHMHTKIDSIYPLIKSLSAENIFHGYDTKVFVMCFVKQIFKETDTTAIIMLLQSLASIVQNSSIKDDLLQKNKMKKRNPVKLSNQLRKIDQFDKLPLTIDSPFKNDKEISFLISNMFNEIKKSNIQTFNSLLANLSKDTIISYQKFINFDQLQKKPRIIRKVIGLKQTAVFSNEIQTEQEPKIRQQMNDSESDEQDCGLKRQRVKVKVENKNKLIKTERKRHHNDEEK